MFNRINLEQHLLQRKINCVRTVHGTLIVVDFFLKTI